METLKENEIRIGNWVKYYKGESTGEILGMTFSVFSKNNKVAVSIEPPEDTGWTQTSLDDLQPIPITEEWLLHFGWVWNERTNSFENNDTRMHLEYRKLNGSYTMFNYVLKAKIAERIWHVHQLQNLYFALTGNELTIKS